MIAEYKGKQYKIVKDGKSWELVSKNPDCVKDGFVKDGKLFYKSVNDLSQVDDVYDMWVMVEYDTHLEKVNKTWRLEITKEFFTGNEVKLLFGEGILPGWKVEDKNVCSKYVNVCDISTAFIIKKSVINNSEKRERINSANLGSLFNTVISL